MKNPLQEMYTRRREKLRLTGMDYTTQVKESDNESDRIPGCEPTFGSLVFEPDGILVSEFDGNYRWVLTDPYY